MQIARRSGGFHFQIDKSAQSDAKRWNAWRVERGIGNQCDVSLELLRILSNILGDGRSADLLFAFDQKLQIDRQSSIDGTQGLDGLDVHVHLTLIVSRTAGINAAVSH